MVQINLNTRSLEFDPKDIQFSILFVISAHEYIYHSDRRSESSFVPAKRLLHTKSMHKFPWKYSAQQLSRWHTDLNAIW